MVLPVATRGKIALVLLVPFACCRPAIGQSSVEIYGIVDVDVVHEGGGSAGSITKVTSGVESGHVRLYRNSSAGRLRSPVRDERRNPRAQAQWHVVPGRGGR